MVRGRLFTEKEVAFIATYRGYGDGARAAAAAGYGAKHARVRADKLLKKPAIRQALEEKQRQIIGEDTSKPQAMSDLERINRGYETGTQPYAPTKDDERSSVTRTEGQKDSKDGLQSRLPSQG
jgi:hypothetical protein